MSRLTPSELARASAHHGFAHRHDAGRAVAFQARGLDEEKLALTVTQVWTHPKTEWLRQPNGGIKWVNEELGLIGAVNFKTPELSSVVPCRDPARQRDSWLRACARQGVVSPRMEIGTVPIARGIREREFKDNLANIAPRKFSDLMRDGLEFDRDEQQRDERSR